MRSSEWVDQVGISSGNPALTRWAFLVTYLVKLPRTGRSLQLSDSRPFDIGEEEDVVLFFAEDLHGFYAGGAKRGEEGGGCGDDEDEQDDGHERRKVGGGDTVEKAGEEASGGNCHGKAGEAAREADGQSLPEKSFNDLAA
jgi:hypothetical protein